MKGGKRKLSQWNIFVKKIYNEGKSKNANYEFRQALADASKRKSEMGSAHGLKSTSKRKSKSKSRSRRTRRKY
jgi:hypothetical protein